jgi:hypothetical protein
MPQTQTPTLTETPVFLYSGNTIPSHLREKIALPYEIADPYTRYRNKTIVDCHAIWGDIHHAETQHLINWYERTFDPSNTIYIFLITDDCEPHQVPPNIRLFRSSLMKSNSSPNEFILPFIWFGLSAPFPPLRRSDRPVVGFCGLVSPNRVKILQLFANDSRFRTNFILRNMFWGGKENDPTIKREFEDNMRDSHFNMCSRGKGNFSMRLYQTLSAGRIPVFVNTDMRLPISHLIDWDTIAVIGQTEEEVVRKTYFFWLTHNIEEAQTRCRQIYDTYFSGTAYMDNLISGTWKE